MAQHHCVSLLNQLQEDSREIIRVAQQEFSALNQAQLNLRPSPENWSILECLEHINITLRMYIPRIEAAINKAKQKGWQAADTYKPGMIGHMFTTKMKPLPNGTIGSKSKTFKFLDPPRTSPAGDHTMQEFIQNNLRMIELVEEAKTVNLAKPKVKSAIGNIIRFKLGDALHFITAHTQRHIQQAHHVMLSESFQAMA